MSRKKADELLKGFNLESTLNRGGDELPFGYYHPETDGKLSWMCGYDQAGKITSVFCMDYGHGKDKKSKYVTHDQAVEIRDELIKAGWQKIKPPKVEFSYADGNSTQNLTRKQRRYIGRQLKKMNRANPFLEGEECKCDSAAAATTNSTSDEVEEKGDDGSVSGGD